MLLTEFKSNGEILKQEFEQRVIHNPSYSLRAFARDLSISPSRLSEVMNKDETISVSSAKVVAEKLFKLPDDAQFFVDLAICSSKKESLQKESAQKRIDRYRNAKAYYALRDDDFKVMSDWFHLAIMELFHLDDFQSNVHWIANKLSITVNEVKEALGRLEFLKVISIEENQIKLTQERLALQSEIPSDAIRTLHRQILFKALNAVDHQSIEERDLTAMILAIHPDQLPKLKEKIREFQFETRDIAHSHKSQKDLYALAIQLFRLSK